MQTPSGRRARGFAFRLIIQSEAKNPYPTAIRRQDRDPCMSRQRADEPPELKLEPELCAAQPCCSQTPDPNLSSGPVV